MSIIKVCATYTIEIDDLRKLHTKEDILDQITVHPYKGTIYTESDLIEAMNIDKKIVKKLITRGLNPYPIKENGEMCFSKNELIRFAKTSEGARYDEKFALFLSGVYGKYRQYAVYRQPYGEKRNVHRAKIIATYWTKSSARRACLKLTKEDRTLDTDGFRAFDYFVAANTPFNQSYMDIDKEEF